MDGCSTRSGPFSLSRRDSLLGQARTDRDRLWWYRLGMGGFWSKTIIVGASHNISGPPSDSIVGFDIAALQIVGGCARVGGNYSSQPGPLLYYWCDCPFSNY